MLSLASGAAHANMGVPMIAVAMPAFVIALIPIIVIEAYVYRRAGFAWGWALKWSAIANGMTTLIGIPATWFALFGLNLLTVGASCGESTETLADQIFWTAIRAPWLCPSANPAAWMLPSALLVLMVPFFLMSWLIESLIIRKANKPLDQALIGRARLRANLTTYALLTLYAAALYAFPL
jgi:hypothetical protein